MRLLHASDLEVLQNDLKKTALSVVFGLLLCKDFQDVQLQQRLEKIIIQRPEGLCDDKGKEALGVGLEFQKITACNRSSSIRLRFSFRKLQCQIVPIW